MWTLALWDATLGAPYLKRFNFEASAKPQRFVGSDEASRIMLLTDTQDPDLLLHYEDPERPDTEVDAAEFIGVKSFKAKGKRLTTLPLREVTEIPKPEPEPETEEQVEDAELNAVETVTESETISDNNPDSSEENTHPTASEPSLFDFDD